MRDGHPAEQCRPARATRGAQASPVGLTTGAFSMMRLSLMIKQRIRDLMDSWCHGQLTSPSGASAFIVCFPKWAGELWGGLTPCQNSEALVATRLIVILELRDFNPDEGAPGLRMLSALGLLRRLFNRLRPRLKSCPDPITIPGADGVDEPREKHMPIRFVQQQRAHFDLGVITWRQPADSADALGRGHAERRDKHAMRLLG